MYHTLTKKEMIHWIVKHPICSNKEIPEWLLELSEPIESNSLSRQINFRELLQIAFVRESKGRLGLGDLETDGYGDPFEWYFNRILHIFDVERLRRKAPYFEFKVDDVFSGDNVVYATYETIEEPVVSYSLDELKETVTEGIEVERILDLWEDDFDVAPDVLLEKMNKPKIIKCFGKSINRHEKFIRLVFDMNTFYGTFPKDKLEDLLDNFYTLLQNNMTDVQESLSFYANPETEELDTGLPGLIVFVGSNERRNKSFFPTFNKLPDIWKPCLFTDEKSPRKKSNLVGYFSPKYQQIYTNYEFGEC